MRPSKSELRKLYDKHQGVYARIAAELQKPQTTVRAWCVSDGLHSLWSKGRDDRPSDEQLRAAYKEHNGSCAKVARHFKIPRTTMQFWFDELQLQPSGVRERKFEPKYPVKLNDTVSNGHVVIFSDAHWWPGEPKTPANEALLVVLKKLKPEIVIANGDIVDGARVSRHHPLGWDDLPMLADELYECQQRMAEICKAAPGSRKYLLLGNHDTRFEKYLVANAKELEGMDGTTLEHYFLTWTVGWALHINATTVIKHNWKSGRYAPFNNAMQSGLNLVTGHLHSQKVHPYTDYTGTRYGVDAGTLANPHGPQFLYTSGNPLDWRSGFCVLTFEDGRLLHPQLATDDGQGRVYMTRTERVL